MCFVLEEDGAHINSAENGSALGGTPRLGGAPRGRRGSRGASEVATWTDGPRPRVPGPAACSVGPAPAARAQVGKRRGPRAPAHWSRHPAAGRHRSELRPGDVGPQGGERGATGGASSPLPGRCWRRGGPRGRIPASPGAAARGTRAPAPRSARSSRGPSRRLSPGWTRTGLLNRVCPPQGGSDGTPKGCLGHGPPDMGTRRLGRS